MISWNFGQRTKGRFDRLLRDYPRATPIGIFLFSLLLVGISAWSVELAGTRAREAAATVQASEIASAIERQATANNAYFQATSALFVGSETISPDFFHQFVQQLRLNYDLTGVIALGWSEAISRDQLPALTRRMVAQGYSDFHVHPEPVGATGPIDVITMLEPRTPSNLELIGFNMRSEKRRAQAMDRARQSNGIAASEALTLLPAGTAHGASGFIVYMPVTSLSGHVFKGYVYGVIRTRDFIRSALKTRFLSAGRIEIFDSRGPGARRIFVSGAESPRLGMPVDQALMVFDQQWLLRYYSPGRNIFHSLTLVVMIGGAAFSLLLLAYILLVQRRNDDLHDLIAAQAERESERAAFVRELNHRVKNTLANVTSIISLTRRSAVDIESYTSDLLERVRALAASHALLDGAQWGPTDLRTLIEAQLGAHSSLGQRIHIHGPNVLISPNDALTVGLMLHELLTNAVRYGALSTPEGELHISWQIDSPELVSVVWEERNGPPVTPPERRGFGLNLIERALAHELDKPITIEFPPSGLRCTFSISLRKPRPFRLRR